GVGGFAVVVADLTAPVIAAGGDDAGARHERAVEAERDAAGLRRALRPRQRLRRASGAHQHEQDGQRPHGRRDYFLAVRISVTRLKNWSSIIRETPPSIRCPTLAMSPPICTSALYLTRVPASAGSSSMRASPRTNPGPPLPSMAIL